MTRPTPASNVIVAAIIAIISGLIAGLLSGGFAANSQLISLVAIFAFVSGLLTPWIAQSLTAKATASSAPARQRSAKREPKPAKPAATPTSPSADASAPASSGQNPDGSDQVTLYVGNLPFKTTEENVQDTFAVYGDVFAVRLVKDRRTGKKKGYGFVEMEPTGAELALAKLNDSEFEGRTLKVRFANTERKD